MEELIKVSAELQSAMFKTTDTDKNVGVVMDSDLNFNSHIKKSTKSYINLRIYRGLKIYVTAELEKLVHAFIFSRIDCNGVFTGLTKKSIRKLQLASCLSNNLFQ